MPEARHVFKVPSEYASVAAALDAAAAVQGTVFVAPGVFREPTTLKVAAGVSVEGSGQDTILEADACTVIVCAEGAVRVANLCIRQVRCHCNQNHSC